MSRVIKPLLLALLSFVMACVFVVGAMLLGLGASEGGLPWVSSATREKIDTMCGILLSPGTVGHLGVVGSLLFYTILFFVAFSLLLRRRPKRGGT